MVKKRTKTQTITFNTEKGRFDAILSRFRSEKKPEKTDASILKSILSPEKARLLHMLKEKQPNSIYELAKLLARDFKSVRQDVLLLQDFGFVELIPIHKGKRQKLKPLLVLDELRINLII